MHWYPINGTPAESVQSIMELIDNIPPAAAEVKAALSAYDPSAYFVVGETNMSQTANEWNEEPVGALFAAANAMEWLSFGAQSASGLGLTSSAETKYSYSAASPSVTQGSFSGSSVSVPAESVVVLTAAGQVGW